MYNKLVRLGGERDTSRYDLNPLRKPVLPMENGDDVPKRPDLNGHMPKRSPGDRISGIIDPRLRDLEQDPTAAPYDELRIWADEGTVQSLSNEHLYMEDPSLVVYTKIRTVW